MTITYDPGHPSYFNEDDLRGELDRVYDLCHGCRMCVGYCTSFPTLFDYVDRYDDQDSTRLNDAERYQVVDECFSCKMCYVKCPYIPPHEWALDFPRLMLRAKAVQVRQHPQSLADRVTSQVLGNTDLMGQLGSAAAPLVNRFVIPPGGPVRAVLDKVAGIASQRVLQPYARQRFSTWFRKRVAARLTRKRARAAIFPTCLVEYQATGVGKDLVKVYERNGIECSVPDLGCCGAPWLHAGDVDAFRKQAERNLPILAEAVRSGQDIVVPQPTCGFVVKHDYLDYVPGPDAELVAANTYDACEYLWKVHKEQGGLDTGFAGETHDRITFHAPCHMQAQRMGMKGRDLLKLTGAKITLVTKCSAIDGTWGYRSANYETAKKVVRPLVKELAKTPDDVIAGECHLANSAIIEETARTPQHPLSLLARAYGIPPED